MPHHTTLNDRARKARIREREYRQDLQKFRKLEAITPAQIKVLKKISEAETAGAPIKVTDMPDWRELRAMGVVREKIEKPNRFIVLTALGAQVATEERK